MHKTVHIRVNLNEGIFYEISRIRPTNEAPKQKEIGEAVSTIAVGLCDDTVQRPHNITSKGIQQWKSWSGDVAKLRLKHIKGEYSICDSTVAGRTSQYRLLHGVLHEGKTRSEGS